MSVKQDKIRILQCVSNMHMAGIETILMNYYRNIDREKMQFDFLVNKKNIGYYETEIRKLGGKIYVSPGLNPFKFFKYQKFMKDLFQKHPEYKIIHCQNEIMGYYALKAAKDNNIPIRIAHSHNTKISLDFKFPIKFYLKHKLKDVSNIQVACGKEAGKFLFGKEVKIINNAIDTDKFLYNDSVRKIIRNKYKINDKVVIGHVGRFESQKNHEFIIDIFNDLCKIKDNYVLLLIGSGSKFERIKKKVCKLGLNKKVIFIGNVSNVNEFYQAMDIFLLPSLHEGLPVVGIEAQAADLLCLFSNKITEEIKLLNKTKYLDICDSNQWVDELLKFNFEKRVNNKKIIENSNFDIKREANKLYEWYEHLYNNGEIYETEEN